MLTIGNSICSISDRVLRRWKPGNEEPRRRSISVSFSQTGGLDAIVYPAAEVAAAWMRHGKVYSFVVMHAMDE